MSDINPIKQAPVQGMTGLSGGPASLLLTPPLPIVPAYIDEVFATDTWFGNYDVSPAAITINNGIDISGEGGLVWTKNRNYANSHQLFDTERGAGVPLYTNIQNNEGSNGRKDGKDQKNSMNDGVENLEETQDLLDQNDSVHSLNLIA